MAKEDKNQKIIRELMQKPENKTCFDCGEKGPVYVCTDFGTFICTSCSGIHRDFNHRVKSISMATFKPEEIEKLKAGGNKVARETWLCTWTPSEYPLPDSQNPRAVKDFMQKKYEEKRWVAKQKVQPTPSFADYPKAQRDPQPEPLSNILGPNIPPLNMTPASPSVSVQPAAPAPAPAPAPAKPAAPPKPTGDPLLDWNPQPIGGGAVLMPSQPTASQPAPFIADFSSPAAMMPSSPASVMTPTPMMAASAPMVASSGAAAPSQGFANFAAFPQTPSHAPQQSHVQHASAQQQQHFAAFGSQPQVMAAASPAASSGAATSGMYYAPSTVAAPSQLYAAAAPPPMAVAPTPAGAYVMSPTAAPSQAAYMQPQHQAPIIIPAQSQPQAQQSFFPSTVPAAHSTAPSYAHYAAAQPVQLQSFNFTPVPANQLFMPAPTAAAPGGYPAYGAAPAAQPPTPVVATAPPKQPEPSPFANLDPLRGMKMQTTPAPVVAAKPAAPTMGMMASYPAQPSQPSSSNGNNNNFDWLQ